MKNIKTGHNKPIVCLDAGHYGKYNQSPVVKSLWYPLSVNVYTPETYPAGWKLV